MANRAIYILFVILIYLNVVMPGSQSFNVIAKKLIFLAIFILFVGCLLVSKLKLSVPIMRYIVGSFILFLLMALYSIVMGNKFDDISIFGMPLLFLFAAPALYALRLRYDLDSILRHLLLGVLVNSGVILAIVGVADIYFNEIANLSEIWDLNYSLMSYENSGLRIGVKTAPFMPVGLLISIYFYEKYRSIKFIVAALVISVAIYFTKTLGIWAGALVGWMSWHLLSSKKILHSALILVLATAVSLILILVARNEIESDELRQKSADIKVQQVQNGLAMFQEFVWFGRGLGYRLDDIDERKDNQPVIEVLPILILVDGGVVGLAFFIFIYFSPFGRAINLPRGLDGRNILVASHLAMIVAGFSNPYLLSGSTGLFFIVLFLAYQDEKQMFRKTV